MSLNRLSQFWGPLHSVYDNAVLAILHVLQDAELTNDPGKTNKALALTSLDLEIMAQDCREQFGPRVLSVTFSTYKGERKPDPGWELYWKKKFFEDNPDVPYIKFDTPSSPARVSRPPGHYLILLRKGARQIGPIDMVFAGKGEVGLQVDAGLPTR